MNTKKPEGRSGFFGYWCRLLPSYLDVYPATFDRIAFHGVNDAVCYVFRYVNVRVLVENIDAADAAAWNVGFAGDGTYDITWPYIIPTTDAYHQAGHVGIALTGLALIVAIKVRPTRSAFATTAPIVPVTISRPVVAVIAEARVTTPTIITIPKARVTTPTIVTVPKARVTTPVVPIGIAIISPTFATAIVLKTQVLIGKFVFLQTHAPFHQGGHNLLG